MCSFNYVIVDLIIFAILVSILLSQQIVTKLDTILGVCCSVKHFDYSTLLFVV